MGSQLELRSEFPNHLVVYDLWLVGGLEHLAYFPFHIWDVILPIDELNHFSRWLLHHQPDDDLWWFMMIWLFNKRWFLIVKRGCSTGWLDLAIRYQSLAKVIKQTWGWEPAIKKKYCLVVLALTPGAGKSVGFQGAPFFTNGWNGFVCK